MITDIENKFMKLAIEQANIAILADEVPVGCVIGIGDEIISTAYNLTLTNSDPTAHAEINAIRLAGKKIKNYRLPGAVIYTTLEPCAMCYGAIVHARIARLVFGAYDTKTGVCGSSIKLHEQKCFNHVPEIKGGVLEDECSLILKNFFKERRN